MSKKNKIRSRTKLKLPGLILFLSGLLFKFVGPFVVAGCSYMYYVDSIGAKISYSVIFALILLLIGTKIYINKKTDGLRVEVANYKTSANLEDGKKLTRALEFYKRESLLLAILDNAMYTGLIALFYLVCFVSEKGLAKLAFTLGLCFLSVAIGAVCSVCSRLFIKGEEDKENA